MQIISRAEARAAGAKRYFTGKPCKHGHLSERRTSNGQCVACLEEYADANRDRIKQNKIEWERKNADTIRDKRRAYWRENRKALNRKKRLYREANPDKVREQKRRDYLNRREAVLAKSREYYLANREAVLERVKEYREENADKISEYFKHHYVANKKAYLRRNAVNEKRRYREDPDFRMMQIMRSALRRCLKQTGEKSSARTITMLGYTPSELRDHLERQFLKGMSWDNHGEWHIDHIVPVAEYLRNGETDPAIINCLTNLRPIWARENYRKSDQRTHLL